MREYVASKRPDFDAAMSEEMMGEIGVGMKWVCERLDALEEENRKLHQELEYVGTKQKLGIR